MIRVIDNVISEKYSQFLFEEIVKLKWTFVPNLSYSENNSTDNCGFSYNFFLAKNLSSDNIEKKLEEYHYIKPLLLDAFEKFGLNVGVENVVRCRARLTVQKHQEIIEDKHNDYSFPHLVLIYYINTTDGDTVLFEKDQIVERVSPKRGRCILFDGNILHASSSSTLSPRIVLNTNII